MSNKVNPIPEGHTTLTPYIIVKDAAKAIDFYKKAFDATELMRMDMPNGKVGHAEIKIGNASLMLADECPEMNMKSPSALAGTSVMLVVYVKNVDEFFEQAIAAGGEVARPVKDQVWGDRSGALIDPFGHYWTIATHIKDVCMDEILEKLQTSES